MTIEYYKQKNLNYLFSLKQMIVMNVTDDYDNITLSCCSNIGNEEKNIVLKYLLPSILGSILLFSVISLRINSLIKPLIK